MNEEQVLKARLKDLADRSYKQNIYTYSAFLNPSEIALFNDLKNEMSYVKSTVYGGADICERQLVQFGSASEFGYEGVWPISVLLIEPLIEKFSDDLNHRDFLGAIMNLGVERNVIGDILVKDKKRAYIFCLDSIADFLKQEITKIKHTNVKCSILSVYDEINDLKPTLIDMNIIVASPRFDAIVASANHLSRNESLNLFKAKLVSLNGAICENNSMTLKAGDIFSVRGYGKFCYVGSGNETRKGRIYIHLQKYA